VLTAEVIVHVYSTVLRQDTEDSAAGGVELVKNGINNMNSSEYD